MKNIIEISNLSYTYDQRTIGALRNVNLNLKKASHSFIVGPSGSGKSTLLSLIARNDTPQIKIDTKDIALITSDYKLAQEKSIMDLIASAYSLSSDEETQINQARLMLSQFELTSHANKTIHQLSTGQKQRVYLCTKLINAPELILLDEPFSNLDISLRIELYQQLLNYFHQQEITSLWVTHQTEEAMRFADDIIVINYGAIEQIADPQRIYLKPKTLFVAQHIKESNALVVPVTKKDKEIEISILGKTLIKEDETPIHYNEALLIIRPEFISFKDQASFSATIKSRYFEGPTYFYEIETLQHHLCVRSPKNLAVGSKVKFDINIDQCHLLNEV